MAKKKANKNKEISPSNYLWKKEITESLPSKEKFGNSIFIPGNNLILKGKIVDLISSAKEVLFICSFIIADDDIEKAIINAANRDVRVYILTAYEQKFLKLMPEGVNEEPVIQKHRKFIAKLRGKALVRSSPDYHTKLVIADPKDEMNKRGYLLTCNLKEKPLKLSPEIGMKLNKKEIGYFSHKFIEGFSHPELAKTEIDMVVYKDGELGFSPISSKVPVKIREPDYSDNLYSTIYDKVEIKDELLKLIDKSKGDITLFSYQFDDNEVTKTILNALDNKRKVVIYTYIDPEHKNPNVENIIEKFKQSGAEIIGIDYLHAKGIIVNIPQKGNKTKKLAIIMTANYTSKGLDMGYDFAIKYTNERVQLIEQILDSWKSNSCWVLVKSK